MWHYWIDPTTSNALIAGRIHTTNDQSAERWRSKVSEGLLIIDLPNFFVRIETVYGLIIFWRE